jgi:hypothetical protein
LMKKVNIHCWKRYKAHRFLETISDSKGFVEADDDVGHVDKHMDSVLIIKSIVDEAFAYESVLERLVLLVFGAYFVVHRNHGPVFIVLI